MLKKRLIPVLLLKNGLLVRSEKFSIHQIIGNPIHEVERFNQWNVDELVYIDITREGDYDLRRDDTRTENLTDSLQILRKVSQSCFMPLTWGGRIRNLEQMREKFENGADKITLNTAALQNPDLIQKAAQMFGSQAIVISMDVQKNEEGADEVMGEGGRWKTGRSPQEWAREVQDLGAGEIFLQSMDQDGVGEGYDTSLLKSICETVTIPVIACSGVGTFEDFIEGSRCGASAVAAANIWHFKEMVDRGAKRVLKKAGVPVRTSK